MIKIALSLFIKRRQKSFIVVISAMSLTGPSTFVDPCNTVPFMSIYEGINAFSYFHANSVYEELKTNPIYKNIDFINITPAGVNTSNTKDFLKNTPFISNNHDFVKSSIKLIGNFNGTTCGSLIHSFSYFLPSFIPMSLFFKKQTLYNTGLSIAKHYMKNNI